MNHLNQHILSKCNILTLTPDPFLYGSMNRASKQGIVVCDLDSSLSDWIFINQEYFKRENVTWVAYNSNKDSSKVFEITRSFIHQRLEEQSVDFQVLNHACGDVLNKVFFQKVAYCSKLGGRFLCRDILWDTNDILDRCEFVSVSNPKYQSDDYIQNMVLESGFSKCVISRKSYPLMISNLLDYEKWLKELLLLLQKDIRAFSGFSQKERQDKDFQLSFFERQEVVVRELFAIK